jgi:hypothetical protein
MASDRELAVFFSDAGGLLLGDTLHIFLGRMRDCRLGSFDFPASGFPGSDECV